LDACSSISYSFNDNYTALKLETKDKTKLILIALSIYALAIIATTIYFVPGLLAFANSNNNPTVTPSEWFQRGQTWQRLSWIRGFFSIIGFVLLLAALTKDKSANNKL